jgi:hypothetical protein
MRCIRGLLPVALVLAIVLLDVVNAAAAPAGPGWSIRSLAQPSNFSSATRAACEHSNGGQVCDTYALIVTNVGNAPAPAGSRVTIADALPAGVHVAHMPTGKDLVTRGGLECSEVPLQCIDEAAVAPGHTLVVTIYVTVERKLEEAGVTSVTNTASVAGGNAPAVTTSEENVIAPNRLPFGIADFALQAFDNNGEPSTQAGGHPYVLTTNLYFTSENQATDRASEEVKDIVVDLPPGLVGSPQAAPKCPLYALLQGGSGATSCPLDSRVGTVVFEAAPGLFRVSEGGSASQTTAIYNMEPEPGFPAEFGFAYLGHAVYMYASSVRIGGQLRLRVTAPGIPELETIGVTLLFFGDPGEADGGTSSLTPFLTNPVDCAAGPLSANVEVDTWQHPGYYHLAESTTYPQLTGCNLLQFHPTLSVRPETTQADEPSGYTFEVAQQQNESPLTPATSELKDATVTLPAGVSISPSAADGLRGCAAMGAEGINIGSVETGESGRDLGDEGATELGAGHTGGDGSPYDDGLYHTAPGRCPAASTVGTVEINTPLLSAPLQGHVYVALPGCGGSGQPGCTEQDASDGNLFGVYLEAAGSGAIVKLAGSVSVNPATHQLTASFRENPQLPFSSLRLYFYGGPRAVLANPQACGSATASANFSAWSSPATLDSQAFSPFTVDWDGAGAACPAVLPLTPSMTAQMTNPAAGAFSPFSFSLSRSDRQQYLSQLSVTTPPGMLAMISSVSLCGEPQAAAGTCSSASEIGTATVAAGAGSHPFWVTGHVYLTTGYNGAPFGLTIVVPAQAGPFNLGDVVVRSAITVDPSTSAVTISSGPLPQVIDGIPLRVQTVDVDVNRPGFMFNPTNCGPKQVAVTVAGAQGATTQVSSPFAAANCKSLPFNPTFTASSQARTSKANGASLNVKVSYKPGQANIKSVAVTLPKQLPARLTTIQQACLAATFEVNPAACPAGSLIGIVKASTPVLPVPLSGPAYLVSHGNAAFPDVVVILQGDGVRLDLTGSINIAKDITSSTFANVPDAPVTSFELILPEGSHSALATNLPAKDKGDLCGTTLTMPTTLTGQNGLQVKQSTKITVGGCPKSKPKKKIKPKKRAGKASRHDGGGGK